MPLRSGWPAATTILRILLIGSLAWSLPAAPAADGKEANARPADDRAGRDLDDLRRRIRDAQRDLSATEESRTEAADALRKSEQAISDATRALRELAQREADAQSTLAELTAAQATSREAIATGQTRLAALLRHEYRAGGDDSLTVLLSGGDPAAAGRDAEYLRRLALARQASVAALRHDLEHLAELNQQAEAEAAELERTRAAHARQRSHLQQESAAHAQAVAELSTRLQAQRRNLQTMENDEKRLTQLVERIARALEERRVQREKAQREKAEHERQQREKAARANRERKPGEGHPGDAEGTGESAGGESGKGGADGRKPPEVVARIDESAQEGYDTEAFPRMKGHLRLPVTGELANRFGSPREDSGLNWKGLFIRAAQGKEVHAVASGRVVYSDWLRGFGNLLIIDHGGGYMSLYGNVESLFARVGDVVKGGVAVASVGNSGGNPEPGLYFEIRYQSRPFDPMSWVGRN